MLFGLFYEVICCLSMCHLVLVFFSPFSIAITSLGEERANLSAFRTFVRFVLVWICRFPLPLGVWEGLRFVIVALPGFFSYLLCIHFCKCSEAHFVLFVSSSKVMVRQQSVRKFLNQARNVVVGYFTCKKFPCRWNG